MYKQKKMRTRKYGWRYEWKDIQNKTKKKEKKADLKLAGSKKIFSKNFRTRLVGIVWNFFTSSRPTTTEATEF